MIDIKRGGLLYYSFLLLLTCQVFFLRSVNALDVHVSQISGVDDKDCIYGNRPCKNLTYALTKLKDTDGTSFYIEPDIYILETEFTFINVNNMKFLASGNGIVEIQCIKNSTDESSSNSSGLSFINSHDITLKGISFQGCGVEHNSTTLYFEEENENSEPSSFVTFYATLYFEQCHNVHLESLIVRDSYGVGIQMYATVGIVNILNCQFINNPEDSTQLGGGLLIEFPYCLPGDMNSCSNESTFVPMNIISDSTYFISECTFEENKAKFVSIKEKFLVPFKINYEAFGFGGGLSIVFRANASNNVIQIDTCSWHNNTAMYGGGLYVKMTDDSYNNIINVIGSNVFTNNIAYKNGGGVTFNYLFLESSVFNNTIQMNGMSFNNNTANDKGGAIYFLTTLQPSGKAPNKFEISNTKMENNSAKLGSAIELTLFHPVSGDYISEVILTNCSFKCNSIIYIPSYKGTVLGTGAMHVEQIPIVFRESIEFMNNTNQSALVVSGTKVEFAPNTKASFYGNSGENGGAISIYSSAYIRISQNTSFVFTNNTARERGGAIYSHSFGTSIQKTSLNCMMRYYDITIPPEKWNTSFIFTNNTANDYPNAIYASTIHPCALLSIRYREDQESIFCWNNDNNNGWVYNDSKTKESCKGQIQTDISSFSTSNSTIVNENDLRSISVIPGNKTNLNLKPLNDQDNTVHGYILHAYAKDNSIAIDEDYYYFSNPNIILYKSNNNSNNSTSMITVDTIQTNIVQVDIEVKFQECNAAFELKENKHGHYGCECIFSNNNHIVCDNSSLTAKLLHGFWIGMYNDLVMIGHCLSCKKNISSKKTGYKLDKPLEEIETDICNYGSTGVLCSTCSDGYAPAIDYNGLICVDCNDTIDSTGVSLFVVFDIILPVVFLGAVYLLDVPLTSGLLHGPILICQMVSTVGTLDAGDIIPYKVIFNGSEKMEATYTALYNFFNLYFGRSLLQQYCLSDRITHYATMIAINYVPSLLPLVIVLLFAMVYYCSLCLKKCCIKCFGFWCKPNPNFFCHCCKKSSTLINIGQRIKDYITERRNKANFLATAILLSYTKLAVTTCYLLTPVLLHGPNEFHPRVMYLDGTITYMSQQHIPYLVIAIIFGGLFLIIVPLTLFLYRPNDPQNNGGFLNSLLGQYQDEFRTRELPKNVRYKEWEYDKNVRIKGKKLFEIRGEGHYSCCNPTTFFCKLRCTRRCNLFFNTNISRYDFRWFAGVIFVLRLLIILSFAVSWTSLIQYVFQVITCIVYAIVVMAFRPFKKKEFSETRMKFLKKIDPNFIEASSMLLLALMFVLSIYQYYYTVTGNPLSKPAYIFQVFLAWIPLLWIAFAYCVLFYLHHREGLRNCCCRCFIKRENAERRRLIDGDHTSVLELHDSGRPSTDANGHDIQISHA